MNHLAGEIIPEEEQTKELLSDLESVLENRKYDPEWVDYDLLRWNICNCEVRHGPECRQVYINVERPLLWLIDVREHCLVDARLYSTARYAALSYVWGGDQKCKTELCNIEARQLLGSLSEGNKGVELPQTIRDTMHLVCRLGIRFLWVDSLCIVQDDTDAKQSQIDAMGSIYRQAFVTIIACKGGHADFGLHGLRDVSNPKPRDRESAADELQLPWYTRGWTFQELVCSNRRIIFTDEFRWECPHTGQSESTGTWTGHTSVPRSHIWGRDFTFLSADMKKYGEIVDDYTSRNLTFPTDILEAFKGILSLLEQSFKAGFLYAIPEDFFDIGLLWQPMTSEAIRRLPNLNEKQTHFPSWSWLAWKLTWEGGIDCNNFYRAYGRERWSREQYFQIRDIAGHAGFLSLCRWYRYKDRKWKQIMSSSKIEEPRDSSSHIGLDAVAFGAAISVIDGFLYPKLQEECQFIYCYASKGSFQIAERSLPEELQLQLGVVGFPYGGLRFPQLCILDSQGAICGVLPRGVPHGTPVEAVYDFIAISKISILRRIQCSHTTEDEAILFGRNRKKKKEADSVEGDSIQGNNVEADSVEGEYEKNKTDDDSEVESTMIEDSCYFRYNVLLVEQRGSVAYARVALGLIISEVWEREKTDMVYVQLG